MAEIKGSRNIEEGVFLKTTEIPKRSEFGKNQVRRKRQYDYFYHKHSGDKEQRFTKLTLKSVDSYLILPHRDAMWCRPQFPKGRNCRLGS